MTFYRDGGSEVLTKVLRYLSMSAMTRGHKAGCIELVVRYQVVGCVCLMKVPFQPLMKLQVQGRLRIGSLICVLCGDLPDLRLPKKEGEKPGRRIEGRELAMVFKWFSH